MNDGYDDVYSETSRGIGAAALVAFCLASWREEGPVGHGVVARREIDLVTS